MELKTRIVSILAVIMLLVFGAAACDQGGPNYEIDDDGNIVITKPVVLRFAAPDGSFKDEIEQFAAGFKKLYPQVTIKYEPISGDWTSKLLTQIGGGNAPDLFWAEEIYSYASRGALEDLNPYFEKLGEDRDDYFQGMFLNGTYKDGLYMLPREYNKVVTYYNKKIFDKAFGNLPLEQLPYKDHAREVNGKYYPANGWTWDEFVATAQALAIPTANGQGYLQRGADISFHWPSSGPILFDSLGGTIRKVDGDGKEYIDFDNANNAKILQTILDLTNSGAFVNPALNDVGTMLEGNIGMIFNSRPATMEMENKFGSDWDVVTFPIVPGKPQIGSGSSGYAVYSKSKNKELAVRLLFYMTSKEGQELFMKTGNCVPVKESLITSSTWKENPRSDINHEAFIWKDEYDVPAYNLLFDSLIAKNKFAKAWGEVSTALFNGDKTLSEAMRYGQEQLENIFIDN